MAKKPFLKCSLSLAVREIRIQLTLRLHLTIIRMAVIKTTVCEGEEKEEPTFTVGGSGPKLAQPLWDQRRFSEN